MYKQYWKSFEEACEISEERVYPRFGALAFVDALKSMRHANRFPEESFYDTTLKTMRQGLPVGSLVGIDSRRMTCHWMWVFIKNEQVSTFGWVFLCALRFLYGSTFMRRMRVLLTDGDENMTAPLRAECSSGGMLHALLILRCMWHIFVENYTKAVRCVTIP